MREYVTKKSILKILPIFIAVCLIFSIGVVVFSESDTFEIYYTKAERLSDGLIYNEIYAKSQQKTLLPSYSLLYTQNSDIILGFTSASGNTFSDGTVSAMQFAENTASEKLPCVAVNEKPLFLHNEGSNSIVLYDDGTAEITQFPISLQIQINMSLFKISGLNTKENGVSLFENGDISQKYDISKCVKIFIDIGENPAYDRAIIGKVEKIFYPNNDISNEYFEKFALLCIDLENMQNAYIKEGDLFQIDAIKANEKSVSFAISGDRIMSDGNINRALIKTVGDAKVSPKSAIGITKDGKIIFFTTENNISFSCLFDFLINLNCVDAIIPHTDGKCAVPFENIHKSDGIPYALKCENESFYMLKGANFSFSPYFIDKSYKKTDISFDSVSYFCEDDTVLFNEKGITATKAGKAKILIRAYLDGKEYETTLIINIVPAPDEIGGLSKISSEINGECKLDYKAYYKNIPLHTDGIFFTYDFIYYPLDRGDFSARGVFAYIKDGALYTTDKCGSDILSVRLGQCVFYTEIEVFSPQNPETEPSYESQVKEISDIDTLIYADVFRSLFYYEIIIPERIDGKLYYYPEKILTNDEFSQIVSRVFEFNPQNYINGDLVIREEAFYILGEYFGDIKANSLASYGFSDYNTVSPFAMENIARLAQSGMLSGDKINPRAYLTRGDICEMIYNFIQK